MIAKLIFYRNIVCNEKIEYTMTAFHISHWSDVKPILRHTCVTAESSVVVLDKETQACIDADDDYKLPAMLLGVTLALSSFVTVILQCKLNQEQF